jgi:hypothetical protein
MFIDDGHLNSSIATDDDLVDRLYTGERRRTKNLYSVSVALTRAAVTAGQTNTQARDKVEQLYRLFATETFLYTLLGTSDLADAIQADVTLPWLDIDVSGKTIRQRLIEKLT